MISQWSQRATKDGCKFECAWHLSAWISGAVIPPDHKGSPVGSHLRKDIPLGEMGLLPLFWCWYLCFIGFRKWNSWNNESLHLIPPAALKRMKISDICYLLSDMSALPSWQRLRLCNMDTILYETLVLFQALSTVDTALSHSDSQAQGVADMYNQILLGRWFKVRQRVWFRAGPALFSYAGGRVCPGHIHCFYGSTSAKWTVVLKFGRKRPGSPLFLTTSYKGFLYGSAGKESICNTGDLGSIPGLGRSPEKGTTPHSSILTWRSPWGRKESDTTKQLSLSAISTGNLDSSLNLSRSWDLHLQIDSRKPFRVKPR